LEEDADVFRFAPGERVELKAVHDFELKLSDGKDLYKNWKKGELMMIQLSKIEASAAWRPQIQLPWIAR
jgi:hypothetical protein